MIDFVLAPKKHGDWLVDISGEARVTNLGKAYADKSGAFGPDEYEVEVVNCWLTLDDVKVDCPRAIFKAFESEIVQECMKIYEGS